MSSARLIHQTELLVTGGQELRDWREGLRVRVPGYQYTPQFRAKRWDGWHRPGKWCRAVPGGGWEFRCSRGLLARLRADLYPGLQVEGLEETNGLPDEHLYMSRELFEAADPPLRDYQKSAVVRSLQARWGRIALATNAGKGAVIALLSQILNDSGTRVLVLCDEIAVFDALTEQIEEWAGTAPGRVEGGADHRPEEPVVVAMVRTLGLRLASDAPEANEWSGWLEAFGATLLDEADKATAKTWRGVLSRAKHAQYRLGFSGTFPTDRYGQLVMDELLGPELINVKNLELVERGISARPEVTLHGFDAAPALARPPVEWPTMTGPEKRRWVYERAILDNDERHEYIAGLLRPGVATCVIVNRVEHGERLEGILPNSRFLSGRDTKQVRTDVLRQFRERELDTLIVTRILDRGTNQLGHAVDLIFASAEGSSRQTLQRIGRGLRRTDGKEFLNLVDIIDRGHKYLHTAGRKRVKLYTKEGFEVHVQRETTAA